MARPLTPVYRELSGIRTNSLWAEVLAAALLATAPVALLVLVAQRRLVSGLTAGSVKG